MTLVIFKDLGFSCHLRSRILRARGLRPQRDGGTVKAPWCHDAIMRDTDLRLAREVFRELARGRELGHDI